MILRSPKMQVAAAQRLGMAVVRHAWGWPSGADAVREARAIRHVVPVGQSVELSTFMRACPCCLAIHSQALSDAPPRPPLCGRRP
jgi:hypothetical protein